MPSRIGQKKRLWIGGLAVAALLVLTALPGFAAATRTIALEITSPSPNTAAANTSVLFKAKVTNNSPVGSVSNPSSIRVTVPTGFTITGTPVLSTQASGESSNANSSATIVKTSTTVTVNNINPLQRLQFVTVRITATTASLGACSPTGTLSSPWGAAANTGSTLGQGQPFTLTTSPQTLLTKSCSAPGVTTIVSNPNPPNVTVGQILTFTATTSGDPTPTITWQHASDAGFTALLPVPCVAGPTCTITATLADNGTYFGATASNGIGVAVSNAVQVTVFSAPTIQIDVDTDANTTPPSTATYPAPPPAPTVTFYASTTGTPASPMTITWQHATDAAFANLLANPCATGVATQCSFTPGVTDDGTFYRATASNGVLPDGVSNVIQIAYDAPCGSAVTEGGGGTTVEVTLVKNPESPPGGCTPKGVALTVGQRTITVVPTGGTCDSLATCATYVVKANDWAPEPLDMPVPATMVSPKSLTDTGEEAEVWCEGTYDPNDLPENGGTYGMSMPAGHAWCRVLQSTTPAGNDPADASLTPDILPGTPLMIVKEISLLIGDASRNR